MEPNVMFKQMLQFNKTAFDNGYNAVEMVNEQNEKIIGTMMDQAVWVPEEGKKLVNDWLKAYKKGCSDFKKTVEDNFKQAEDYFTFADKEKKTKTAAAAK